MSTPRRKHGRILIALVLSLVVHAPAVYLIVTMLGPTIEEGDEDPAYVAVTPVFQESDPRNPNEEQRAEDEEYEPEEELPRGQVVDTSPAENDERPDEADLLSERDQVVEEQRQAWARMPGQASSAVRIPRPPSPAVPPSPVQEPAETEPDLQAAIGEERNDRGLQPQDRGAHNARQAPPRRPPSQLQLDPSYAQMAEALGAPGLDDLGDLEEGAENLLSTARWLHAPFFQRVKHQVEQYWRPDLAFGRHDPGGHIYGYRDRQTVVRIVLDPTGRLERAYVIQGSGAEFLDDEAVRAIEQAAPFPNPPQGLVDPSTDRIVFAFSFTVILSEQPIFRMRRYH